MLQQFKFYLIYNVFVATEKKCSVQEGLMIIHNIKTTGVNPCYKYRFYFTHFCNMQWYLLHIKQFTYLKKQENKLNVIQHKIIVTNHHMSGTRIKL